jgi:cellulose synthase/poly-beta-1,6-N-acetylglucosamine synthase-like glycosyltransferase
MHQSYPRYEVIIVNDGPDPEITKLLEAHAQSPGLKHIRFDATQKKIPGKKAPLSFGIHAARYEWILLTDADCMVHTDWIQTMMHHIQDGEIVLGYGPHTTRSTFLNVIQRFDNVLIAMQYLGAALRRTAFMSVGRNLLYRKSLFMKAEGFQKHAHLASGDDDLLLQEIATTNNTAICLNPMSFAISEAPASWKSWLHQKRRHLSTGTVYTWKAKVQTTLFALTWIIQWALFPTLLVCSEIPFAVLGIGLGFWLLFGLIAYRLKQQSLIVWFPILAPAYCVALCTFAVIMTLGPPDKWNRS